TPQGGTTQVTWTMDGHNDFVGKTFSLVMNMDKMVGGDFERGLAQLKAVAEGEAVKPASAQAPAPSSR
ncbi:MAG TPA: SRPBCC family protein, partial [Mycobacteriales bacterium]|nr:SRPBCC family protein [Mycobacteriales bacterium]